MINATVFIHVIFNTKYIDYFFAFIIQTPAAVTAQELCVLVFHSPVRSWVGFI